MATHQVNLSQLSREELIDLAKRQASQIKDKNLKLQEFSMMQLTDVKEQQHIIDQLKADVMAKVTQISEMEAKSKEWKSKVMLIAKQDTDTIQFLRKELETIKQQQHHDSRSTPLVHQRPQDAAAIHELQEAVKKLTVERNTLKEAHEFANDIQANYTKQLAKTENELKRLRIDLSNADAQIDSLQAAQSEEGSRVAEQLATATAELSRVTEENGTLRGQINILESSLSNSQNRTATLEDRVEHEKRVTVRVLGLLSAYNTIVAEKGAAVLAELTQ